MAYQSDPCVTGEKICFLNNYCPPYLLPALEILSKRHNIHFLFSHDGSNRGWDNYGTIRHSVCSSGLELLLSLLTDDYDVLVSTFPTWSSLLEFTIAKVRSRRLVIWVEEWHEPRTKTRRLLGPVVRFIASKCDAIVVSGSAAHAHMMDYGATPDRIFVAPNASWVPVRQEHALERRACPSTHKFTILYLGRLVTYKGADHLVRAFSMLERERYDAQLLIVGDGDFRAELERLVRELRLRHVRFIGACGEEDKADYYRTCDVFVLPSVCQPHYCEAWGLTINEAMQFGKPVITTDAVGAAFDVVKDGVNGFVVRNGDTRSLYQALKKLLDDLKLVERMGTQSKRIIYEEFTYQHMVGGFEQAISFVQTPRRNTEMGITDVDSNEQECIRPLRARMSCSENASKRN